MKWIKNKLTEMAISKLGLCRPVAYNNTLKSVMMIEFGSEEWNTTKARVGDIDTMIPKDASASLFTQVQGIKFVPLGSKEKSTITKKTLIIQWAD